MVYSWTGFLGGLLEGEGGAMEYVAVTHACSVWVWVSSLRARAFVGLRLATGGRGGFVAWLREWKLPFPIFKG